MGNGIVPKKCEFCGKFYDTNSYDICPHCGNDNVVAVDAEKEEKKGKKGSKLIDILGKRTNNRKDTVKGGVGKAIHTDAEVGNSDEADDSIPLKTDMGRSNEYESDNEGERRETDLNPIIPDKDVMSAPRREVVIETKQEREFKTVQIYSGVKEPVVGWLVCVRGECVGDSFEIRGGSNKVGRAEDGDIVIPDKTVSREQAIIRFEPRKREFYLVPKDNASFVYIDGEAVMERISLKRHMHIELGQKTEFVFVPLCCDDFNWDTYMNE